MSKHRVGDRRIISISIPEDLAVRLDRSVGNGRRAHEEGLAAALADRHCGDHDLGSRGHQLHRRAEHLHDVARVHCQ